MTTPMSSPERIVTCLQLKETDRLPVIPVLMTRAIRELDGVLASDAQRKPELMAAAKLKALEKYGGDAVVCGTDLFVEAEALGARLDYLPKAQPSLVEHPVQHREQVECLKFQPEVGRALNVAQEIRLVKQAINGSKIIGAVVVGPLSLAALLVGSSTFLRLMEEDEAFALTLLGVATDTIQAYATILLEAGAQALNMLDPFASSDVISPENYLKYAHPFQSKIMAHIGANGVAPLLHICGYTEPIWSQMATTGAIGLHGDFWPGMDRAKQAVGGKIALFGAVNPFKTLLDGTPEDVRRECLALATRVGYNGGFVLAAGCDLDWNVPDENIFAMVRAAEEVTYPFDPDKFSEALARPVFLSGELEFREKQAKGAADQTMAHQPAEQEILDGLRDAVLHSDGARCRELTEKGLQLGLAPTRLVFDGMCVGMRICGEMYERHERFVTDMLKCSRAMEKGLEIVVPLIKAAAAGNGGTGAKVVLGVVRGNTQDIGKNLVALMLTANGFDVIDLGKNVKPETFVETAERERADVIGMSVMTNSSIAYVEKTLKLLEEKGLRNQFGMMVGGAAANPQMCKQLGAFFGTDANAAVDYVRHWQQAHRH